MSKQQLISTHPSTQQCFRTFVVCGDEAEDILVPEHDGLVDLGLPKPRAFLSGGEDLDGHLLSSPLAPPHLSEAALPDALLQDDGSGYSPLHQQRETWNRADAQTDL